MQRWFLVEWNSGQLPRLCGERFQKNFWVVVAEKRLQAESFQQNLQNKPIGREQTILQTIVNNHVEQFLLLKFCGSFW